ncbi:MAG TPA: efflux transporter outer membrane subunit [Acidobacteriaceae bacterium]|nr:efflux transporter outer membrane subunit [Acidobacteriaceae bacterium]
MILVSTLRWARGPLTILVASLLLMVAGCNLAPKYQRVMVPLAPEYKEAVPADVWKRAKPNDGAIRGRWWEMFDDPQLNTLEEQVDARNQSIAAAKADYLAARAVVRQTRAQYFPTVTTSPSIANSRIAASPYSQANGLTYTEYLFPITASWEPDFWGRIRNTVAASAYAAQASAADLENVRLLAHANLAADYFQMRGVEQQKRVLDATVIAWQKYLDLVRDLRKSGLETDEAVAAAESQLEAAQAQDTNLGISRAQYEHAIAIQIGEAPAALFVKAADQEPRLPAIPPGLPADLLERRPDIASAERAVAAANAQIGVAKAAYFPNITLSATGGIESLAFTDWFTWPSRFWTAGPSAAETIFDAGARRAGVRQAISLRDASAANYRQTVLTSFQQVEDNLAALRILAEDLKQQDAAVQSAKRYLSQATTRNTAGLDPFLNVLVAQVSLLTYQQTYVNFQTQQLIASVQLVEALGGGWNISLMPTPAQVRENRP